MVPCVFESYGYGIPAQELVWKKASAPALEKRHHKYFLRFSYTEEVALTQTPVREQIIYSVDLGINTDAVCTIMRADGTVLGKSAYLRKPKLQAYPPIFSLTPKASGST